MLIDNIVEIDSPIYCEAQYQGCDELVVVLHNGKCFVVPDVSEKEFVKLQKHPTHDTIVAIIKSHA